MNEKLENLFLPDLLYYISNKEHDLDSLKSLLLEHPEIRFVSLIGVDLGGNDTDEKIPIENFLDDMATFINEGIQTDGSSVVLPGIATLNNGKVDLIPDKEVNWFVDYNQEFLYYQNDRPVGTLRIPCFLKHNDTFIDSRSILKQVTTYFQEQVLKAFDNQKLCQEMGIEKNDIQEINLTAATELEFWVRTPEKTNIKVSDLSASEGMQEQYWKRTKGTVRTALERSLILLQHYGLEPEMGHKEVGGVKAKLTSDGLTTDILEQLEVDWKYAPALQAADNELLARTFIKEIFQAHGLDVSFKAKPIEGVAGSGEHTHVGVSVKLKNGSVKNLFTAPNPKTEYLSSIGWGGLLGILKNYEILNPFISATNDSFKRLKPGFEAPICVVASIGCSLNNPSRNRTVLMGLIRDLNNPLATRFEVRSPNPHSNTYLVIATLYQTMLDGIKYALKDNKTSQALEAEFKKSYGEKTDYLEQNRMYHSEEDVFESYTQEELNRFFGVPPSNVWESMEAFKENPEKTEVLLAGDIITQDILNSYCIGAQKRWLIEITNRFIPQVAKMINNNILEITDGESSQLDTDRWNEIKTLKLVLLKDSKDASSLFSQLREAIIECDYEKVSQLQMKTEKIIKEIKDSYIIYKRNMVKF